MGSEDPFKVLQAAVRELLSSGRLTYAAAVKPRMQVLAGFDEKSLGYDSFREFLKEAERLGYVKLWPAPGGDSEVLLPDQPAGPTRVGRIRRDLWRAFVDWDPRLRRLFDPSSEAVRFIPRQPDAAGVADEEIGPRSPIEIEPISAEEQVRWMGQFVESLSDSDVQASLRDALGGPTPLQAFVRRVRATGVGVSWSAELTRHVATVIEDWASSHGLELDIMDRTERAVPRPATLSTQRLDPQRVATRRVLDEAVADLLRSKLHRAIDRMPLADLLRLPLPAEYLLD